MTCPECRKEFVGRRGQRFCSTKCKDAWHNAKKAFSVVLVPRAWAYVSGLAEAHGVTATEIANSMILKMSNADGRPLGNDEVYGQQAAERTDQCDSTKN